MLDDLIARARDLIRPGERHLLGIAGTPGAGKSTVSEALIEALGDEVAVVGMDAFHLANRELVRLGRRDRKGAPDTFDVAGYRALLERLRSSTGETVMAPLFDRSLEEAIAGAVPVSPQVRLVITEGNYLLLDRDGWETIRPRLDAVWFFDIEADERQRRLVARRLSHKHPLDEAVAWVRDVDEPNARIVEATRGRADLVISAADLPRPAARAVGESGDFAPASTLSHPPAPSDEDVLK